MPKTDEPKTDETPQTDKPLVGTDPRDAVLAALKLQLAALTNVPDAPAAVRSTEQQMADAERISVRIPVNPAEKKKHTLVIVNGHRCLVPVGKAVDVPRPVYEQLVCSGTIGAEEGDEHLEPQWTVRSKDGDGDEV